MNDPNRLCIELNNKLDTLPLMYDTSEVPFKNGLYFFYEKGETSDHSPKGRIVRIGNHPRSQDSLKRRLRMHYSGQKNSSVFRRYLGGAIMRKLDVNHPCLKPGAGLGHWEKQDEHTCEKCKPVEQNVSEVLRSNFSFRCIEIGDQSLRNLFENKLIATISLCQVCKASREWLGNFAYSSEVRRSGLWNSDCVGDRNKILTANELFEIERLINLTRTYF